MSKKRPHIEGTFLRNEKGYGFVKLAMEDKKDIYIAENHTKGAMNQDIVWVELLAKEEEGKSAEGKIVKIVKHAKDSLVGTFQKSRNFGFVVPDDKKFGSDIFISKKQFGKAKNKQKVVVQITKYPQKGRKAEGKIIEVLGFENEAFVDMLSLVKEYGLPYEFPENVLQEARSINPLLDKKDIPYRKDFREEAIYTIDGEDAKDLDDAVQVTKTKEGNYLLGVHIADVSYYVKEGSELDKEAYLRGTSVYMLSQVIPMLPKELSNGICSLNPQEDRFTLSCIMEITPKGKVISSDVTKGIIRVKERMTYTNVTKILEKTDSTILKKYREDIPAFETMRELAQILQKRREEEGSLDLNLPESKILLNEQGKPISIEKETLGIANSIIEQFMLIANETIAEKFYWLEAPFVYRVHEKPDLEKVEELNRFLYSLGYRIKKSGDTIYPSAFAEVLKKVRGTEEERVVSNLILHTLKVARYENENKGHFGIASKYYCHFTSPIRRYPDLFIHRIISFYLAHKYEVTGKWKEEYTKKAEKAAQQSSEREKIAQTVERDSEEMKKAEYMEDKIGEEYNGIVSGVTSFGMFVELENTVEGMVRFEDMGKEFFTYREDRKILVGENTKKTYRLGDSVKIRVIQADKATKRIRFQIVSEEE